MTEDKRTFVKHKSSENISQSQIWIEADDVMIGLVKTIWCPLSRSNHWASENELESEG